jgi:MFS transporter, DHA1 family, multidrug resistance protein
MSPDSGAPRPSYAILIAISTVGPLALNIFMPSMPGLQAEFGVTYGVVQLTLTLYLIGMAACQLVYGPLSDRVGRRPMLLGGLVLFVLASLMAALAPSIEVLIAARLLQAMGGAAGIVLARAMVRDVFDRETSASVISYITMAFVVAPMVAPALGGLIDGYFGWRGDFWLLAVFGAIVLIATWKMLPETHGLTNPAGTGMGLVTGAVRLFAMPRFRGYTLTLSFTSTVFFAFLGGAPHIMIDVLHRISAGYMTGNFLSGRYTRKVGIDRMIMTGCLVTLAGGLLCFMAAVSGVLSPATLFLPMALAALGNGLTIPNGTAGAISVDPRLTGAAAGWSGFSQMAFGATASQIVGSLQNDWPTAVFWFMAAASLLALVTHAATTQRGAATAAEDA